MAQKKAATTEAKIQEFHLFAGIGGGIYGGELLGHECCAGVEISDFCQKVLKQRQKDGWMNPFEIYGDLRALNGKEFKGKFDVLCGGFPCQAFSTAAHGKNIAEKNLWDEMLRFAKESDAPVVFGENVVLRAISKACIFPFSVNNLSKTSLKSNTEKMKPNFNTIMKKQKQRFLKR